MDDVDGRGRATRIRSTSSPVFCVRLEDGCLRTRAGPADPTASHRKAPSGSRISLCGPEYCVRIREFKNIFKKFCEERMLMGSRHTAPFGVRMRVVKRRLL